MSEKYYSRTDLVDALMAYTWRDEEDHLIDDADEKRAWIEGWLPDIPPADVQPVVRGRWLFDRLTRTCNACGQMRLTNQKTNFCQNCGADMRCQEAPDAR